MDSGNSGSISSSGDEEYDSHAAADHQSLFLNHPPPTHFIGSSHHNHHPSSTVFDLSSTYLGLHSLPQPHSMLNLDTATSQAQRSELATNCTDHPATLLPSSGMNHYSSFMMLGPHHQDNDARPPEPPANNNNNNGPAARNSKKRTRASRRAPTTVLTTDTTNFRSMVQEFTGIPAPPFSASPYSRRLDLLANSSSLRPSTTTASHHPNPFLLSSSSSSPPFNSRLLHSNMVDAAVASSTTTNASSSSATANNNSSSHHNNFFHLPPNDLGLPYHHQPQNMNLSMQNHPILPFSPPLPISLETPFNSTIPAGYGAKSQASFPMPGVGMSHGQVNNNAHLVASNGGGVSVQPPVHEHVANNSEEGMPSDDGRRRDPFRSLDGKVASPGGGGSC